MPIITDTLPQNTEEIKFITFKDTLEMLPDELKYPLDIWVGGKLARYGQTSDALIFLTDQEDETSTELKLYFEGLCDPYPATISQEWRNERISAVRLYNQGHLIIDRDTLAYAELPTVTARLPIITAEEVKANLPKTIQWKETVYLTGSLVKNGWSGNDVDFMVDTEDTTIFRQMRDYFTSLLGVKVDVGNGAMPEREPIYKVKIYEKGKFQLGSIE